MIRVLRWWQQSAKKGHFHGGIHVPTHKQMSTQRPVKTLPLTDTFFLSLRQRDGNWLEPVINIGETVHAGMLIAQPSTPEGLNLHAPTSGVIRAIKPHPDIHPDANLALTIILDSDGCDDWIPAFPSLNEQHPTNLLIKRIEEAGIAGLGGAGFPSAQKLSHSIETLVVNAAECEPYITCDDMQIRTQADKIIRGAQLAAHIVQASRIVFGIEDDKPQAIAALNQAIKNAQDARISLQVLPTRYPSGNSRQLFELLFGIRVPVNQHATDYGLICHNTGTMKAVYDAVVEGRPLIERYVSVTGEGIVAPQVFRARLGTPITQLIQAAGGKKPNTHLLIGGSMMGVPQTDLSAGINKTTNALLCLPNIPRAQEVACIRCARCADACPMLLLPQQLYWYSRNHHRERLQDYRLFDCIECGICASVCPSNIPLVDYYRSSKKEILRLETEEARARRAKTRHDARVARLDREAKIRAQKMQAKRDALQARSSTTQVEYASASSNKIAAIEEAKARAQARRASRLAKTQSSSGGTSLIKSHLQTDNKELSNARSETETKS